MTTTSKSKEPATGTLPDAKKTFAKKGEPDSVLSGPGRVGVILEVDGCRFTLRKGVETPCWAGGNDPVGIKIIRVGDDIQLGTEEADMILRNHAEELKIPCEFDEPESRLIEALETLLNTKDKPVINADLEIISEESPHQAVRDLARKLLETSEQ